MAPKKTTVSCPKLEDFIRMNPSKAPETLARYESMVCFYRNDQGTPITYGLHEESVELRNALAKNFNSPEALAARRAMWNPVAVSSERRAELSWLIEIFRISRQHLESESGSFEFDGMPLDQYCPKEAQNILGHHLAISGLESSKELLAAALKYREGLEERKKESVKNKQKEERYGLRELRVHLLSYRGITRFIRDFHRLPKGGTELQSYMSSENLQGKEMDTTNLQRNLKKIGFFPLTSKGLRNCK